MRDLIFENSCLNILSEKEKISINIFQRSKNAPVRRVDETLSVPPLHFVYTVCSWLGYFGFSSGGSFSPTPANLYAHLRRASFASEDPSVFILTTHIYYLLPGTAHVSF